MVDEQAERHRAGDHERHRRPQSRQPAQIEIAKTQSAGTVDLTKDAQGEQEAGYGEEHVHANETAGQRALRQVIPDDADQGESLDTVQAPIAVIAHADTPYTTSRSVEVMLEHPPPKKTFWNHKVFVKDSWRIHTGRRGHLHGVCCPSVLFIDGTGKGDL